MSIRDVALLSSNFEVRKTAACIFLSTAACPRPGNVLSCWLLSAKVVFLARHKAISLLPGSEEGCSRAFQSHSRSVPLKQKRAPPVGVNPGWGSLHLQHRSSRSQCFFARQHRIQASPFSLSCCRSHFSLSVSSRRAGPAEFDWLSGTNWYTRGGVGPVLSPAAGRDRP